MIFHHRSRASLFWENSRRDSGDMSIPFITGFHHQNIKLSAHLHVLMKDWNNMATSLCHYRSEEI